MTVEVPTSEADLGAAELLKLEQESWRNNWRLSLIQRGYPLFKKYPVQPLHLCPFGLLG